MPGIDRKIVEHKLPIKEGYKALQGQYADWISNIVTVVKNNGKIRICIDFRDLN